MTNLTKKTEPVVNKTSSIEAHQSVDEMSKLISLKDAYKKEALLAKRSNNMSQALAHIKTAKVIFIKAL